MPLPERVDGRDTDNLLVLELVDCKFDYRMVQLQGQEEFDLGSHSHTSPPSAHCLGILAVLADQLLKNENIKYYGNW